MVENVYEEHFCGRELKTAKIKSLQSRLINWRKKICDHKPAKTVLPQFLIAKY